MKIIDNSTMTPVLKVGTPPREYGSEEIKLGIPGIRGESDQISYKYYDPSIRVGSPPRDGERGWENKGIGEPGFPGPPEFARRSESDQTPHKVGDPEFPGPPGGRDESGQTPHEDVIGIIKDNGFDSFIMFSTSQLFQNQLYDLYLSGKINGEKWLEAAKEYDSSHEPPACTHLTLDQLKLDGKLSDEEYESLLSKYECGPTQTIDLV